MEREQYNAFCLNSSLTCWLSRTQCASWLQWSPTTSILLFSGHSHRTGPCCCQGMHLFRIRLHQSRYRRGLVSGDNIDWTTSIKLDFKHIRLGKILVPESKPRFLKVVQVSSHQGQMVFALVVRFCQSKVW